MSDFYLYNDRPDQLEGPILWWREKSAGYTTNLREAGIYSARPNTAGAGVIMVPVEQARRVARVLEIVSLADLKAAKEISDVA